jgi:tRNA (cmo5U34)-methyltransferase
MLSYLQDYDMGEGDEENRWNEQLSQDFIDFGRYFVPERENQISVIIDLLPDVNEPSTVFELCCGEGLLAEAILERHSNYQVRGYDGSPQMLQKAGKRLERFGERFQPVLFDLADYSWREKVTAVQAVVTSLALHHLVGPEKAKLFADIHQMLAPGGVFIVADIVDPSHPQAKMVAAEAYDAAVIERSQAIDGNGKAFEFFQREGWNIFRWLDPEDIDKPSRLYDQLTWLDEAGYTHIDVFWMRAGHAIFGGWKRNDNVPK